jgi:hypothetical protein
MGTQSAARFARTLPAAFVAALIGVAAVAAAVVGSPLERLLLVVPDDAFYYLQIARQLVATGVSTADGVSPTNGYHPLWMAVCTALAAFVDDRGALLRAALVAALAMHVGAAMLVRGIVARIIDGPWGWAAAILWLLNPVAVLMALQAMECSLYVLLLLVALRSQLSLADAFAEGRPAWRALVLHGAVLGLVILARTEGAAVAALALVWLAGRGWRRAGLRGAGTAVAPAALALGLVVLPWPLFSLGQVGTWTQDSGAMKALWAADLFPDALSRVRNVVDTADYFYRRPWRLMLGSSLPLRPLTVFPLAIAGLVAWALWRRWRAPEGAALRAILLPAAVTGLMYGVSLVERQIWWLGLPWLATCLGGIIAAAAFARESPRLQPWSGTARAALVGLSAVVFSYWAWRPIEPYPWQVDVYRSQQQFEAQVPADQRIGCFNAGIPIYFGTGRVVALDGLVSHAARGFWYDHDVDGYLVHAHVRFIADEQLALNRASRFTRSRLPLTVVARHPLRGWPSRERVLWRLAATGIECQECL